jgi:hypothetical protein
MCSPVALGVASGVASGAGAIGQHQSASAQANAQNAAATSNYKYQLKVRERNWDRERFKYNVALGQYKDQTQENATAAQRAYSATQMKLNDKYRDAAFKNQAMAAKLIETQGGTLAQGMAGRSAQRVNNQVFQAFGRNQAIMAENLFSARTASEFSNQSTRRELLSANRQAYSKVAIQPMPGVAPPPPVMTPGPSGLGLAAGLINAGVTGYSTYKSLKAPSTGQP